MESKQLKMRIDKYVNHDPNSTVPKIEIEAFMKGVVVMILFRENRISHVSIYDQAYAGKANSAILSDVKTEKTNKWTLSERKREENPVTVSLVGNMIPNVDTFNKQKVANGIFLGCVDGKKVMAVNMNDNGEINCVKLVRNNSVFATINAKGDILLGKDYKNQVDLVEYPESKDAFFRRKALMYRQYRQSL